MNSQFSVGRLCIGSAIVALMVLGYQFAMRQAIETVIASQGPPAKLAPGPSFDFNGCDIGTSLTAQPWRYGDPTPSGRCNFDLKPPTQAVAAAAPLPAMSKGESETARLWFILAAIALPLTLGGAMAVTFWIVKE